MVVVVLGVVSVAEYVIIVQVFVGVSISTEFYIAGESLFVS